jgi:hypothetical protein
MENEQDESQRRIDAIMAELSGDRPASPSVVAPVSTQDQPKSRVDEIMTELQRKPPPSAPPPDESGKTPPAATTRRPTLFQTARTPPKKPEPELTWAETGEQAVRNLPRSTFEMGRSMVGALTNPTQTLDSLKQVGLGIVSKAKGSVGFDQDAKEKAKDEAAVNNVINYYKQTYFGSEADFKRALATDPASVLADFSALLTGGATAAGKAGLISTQKAGQVARAASYVDPIAASVKVAKGVTAAAATPIKFTQSGMSGVPTNIMDIARAAGKTDDPVLKQSFLKFYKGDGDPQEFLQTARDALNQVKDKRQQEYLASKGNLANVSASFQGIDDAINEMRKEIQFGGISGGQFADANQALNRVENMVNAYKNNPQGRSLIGVDNLKQAIWDLKGEYGSSMSQRHLGKIYDSAKNAISAIDPSYTNMMEQYRAASDNILDITKTLGIGNKAAASNALAKNLRALKTGKGENLLEQLAEIRPELPYMLAGAQLRPWSAGGWRNTIETLLAFPSFALVHPLAPVGQFIGQSPRIAGATSYAAGKTGALVDKATSAPVRAGLYGAGIANLAAAPPVAETVGEGEQRAIESLKERIASVESEGSGGYFAVGPAMIRTVRGQPFEDQALGKYQVLKSNIPDWTRKYVGREMTPEEFLADPAAQERVFEGAMGDALKRYGNEQDAISWWHSGAPLQEAQKRNATDTLGTRTEDYVNRVMRGEGSAFGGRTQRKSGGRVDNVERLVSQLMLRTKQAKRETTKATEPLLDQPDESIVKALDVAQQAI